MLIYVVSTTVVHTPYTSYTVNSIGSQTVSAYPITILSMSISMSISIPVPVPMPMHMPVSVPMPPYVPMP